MITLEAAEWRVDLLERSDPNEDWFAYVRSAGLDVRSIYAHAGLLAVTHIRVLAGGRFDWATTDDEGAELGAVIEVIEIEGGEAVTVDLVAWSTTEPSRFGTAMGRASLLGGANVANPATYFAGKRLHVHRTPLAWARAECAGVVMLDRVRGLPRLAEAAGELMAEDVAHGRQLMRGLGAMFDPERIFVPASSVRGAA